jgi:hypothetical protein
MTVAIRRRSFFDVMIGEPLELVKSQPHQVLLSTGSIALMGQFAGTDNIVHPFVGYTIAIGVEWAYLRGLASDSRAQTAWGGVLNWSAFGIVVLWGVLWVAGLLRAFDPTNGGWALAAAHVVPVAWLSLCSAQCHRAAMAAERKEERAGAERERIAAEQAEKERRAWELAQEEEDRKLARWKEAYTLKNELKSATVITPVTEVSRPVAAPSRDDLIVSIVTAYKTQGTSLNVSQEARQLGISRALWYKLRDEAVVRGEL